MGERLRLLILCDYIKKEKLSVVGTQEDLTAEIGAVPIFEFLRRKELDGIRLGVLSGSVVIVPADTEELLMKLLAKKDCEGTLTRIRGTGYGKLQVKGKQTHVVAVVTELFEEGRIKRAGGDQIPAGRRVGRALHQLPDPGHLCGLLHAEQPDAGADDPHR